MIYPRFLAQFWAWLNGYFWLPCPLCKEPFAGFESVGGAAVVVKEADGDHMYCVCPRASCQAEGHRQVQEYMQRPWPTSAMICAAATQNGETNGKAT